MENIEKKLLEQDNTIKELISRIERDLQSKFKNLDNKVTAEYITRQDIFSHLKKTEDILNNHRRQLDEISPLDQKSVATVTDVNNIEASLNNKLIDIKTELANSIKQQIAEEANKLVPKKAFLERLEDERKFHKLLSEKNYPMEAGKEFEQKVTDLVGKLDGEKLNMLTRIENSIPKDYVKKSELEANTADITKQLQDTLYQVKVKGELLLEELKSDAKDILEAVNKERTNLVDISRFLQEQAAENRSDIAKHRQKLLDITKSQTETIKVIKERLDTWEGFDNSAVNGLRHRLALLGDQVSTMNQAIDPFYLKNAENAKWAMSELAESKKWAKNQLKKK